MNNKAIIKAAFPLINRLEENGHKAFIVGGAVRNYLMNQPINDVDITTSALPEEVEEIFEQTYPIGKEHGTILVHYGGAYEVTTFRSEDEYVDYRRPKKVQFVTSLKEDLIRRDFTINAMAIDRDLSIIDYASGQQDTDARLIRAVGNPFDRFNEDALRMIRAARFQSVLNFNIETNTYLAIQSHHTLIQHVAIERIMVELIKLFGGSNVSASIYTLIDTGLINYIPLFKEFNIIVPKSSVQLSAFLSVHINRSPDLITNLNQLKQSNAYNQRIKMGVSLLNDERSNELLLYKYGYSLIQSIEQMLQAIGQSKFNLKQFKALQLPIQSRKEINLNGKILMSYYNRPSGVWIKEIMNKVEEAVIKRDVKNEQKELLKWVDKHVKI